MRVVIQRVKHGRVSVAGLTVAEIGLGAIILLGIAPDDGEEQARYLVEKIATLRIFEDEAGKMNLSLLDVGGEAIVVSQFTLYADTRKGNRPSFTDAALPEQARPLVDRFVALLAEQGVPTLSGEFGAYMQVFTLYSEERGIWKLLSLSSKTNRSSSTCCALGWRTKDTRSFPPAMASKECSLCRSTPPISSWWT